MTEERLQDRIDARNLLRVNLDLDLRHAFAAGASLSLIVMMCVATYVHLQPNVPASVLPLGIKPPVIPLSFLLLAAGNLVMHARLWLGRSS